MPGPSCQVGLVAQPPAWIQAKESGSESDGGVVPLPLGLPAPRVTSRSHRAASGASQSSCRGQTAAAGRSGDNPTTLRSESGSTRSVQQADPPSIMELVNAAAKRQEEQEARARVVSSSPRHNSTSASTTGGSSRGSSGKPPASPAASTSGRSNPYFGSSSHSRSHSSSNSTRSSTSSRHGLLSYDPYGRPPMGPSSSRSSHSSGSSRHQALLAAAEHSSSRNSSSRTSGSPVVAPAAAGASGRFAAPAAAETTAATPAAADTPGAAAAAGSASPTIARADKTNSPTTTDALAASQIKSHALLGPSPATVGATAVLPCGSSDCASEDGALTPESSLCSSASSSSLCSYGSGSCSSLGSRPKSILVCRSSSSSVSSACAAAKHVTWRDGQHDQEAAGQNLVAVKLLQDCAEIRRLRKDTWPERSSSGRSSSRSGSSGGCDADQAAAEEGQAAAAAAAAAASSNHRIVAAVMDWREKLRLLAAERRQARVAQLQASWTARQQQQQHEVQASRTQHRQEYQQQQADAASQLQEAATVTADAVSVKAGQGAVCPVVITVQAVSSSSVAIASH